MSYTPRTWTSGEVITAAKLNNIETGISEAAQSGGGYDAIVRMYHSNNSADDWEYTIESGTFANLQSMVSDNIAPNILVRCFDSLNDVFCATSAVAIYGIENDNISFSAKMPTYRTGGTYSTEWVRKGFWWYSNDTITD